MMGLNNTLLKDFTRIGGLKKLFDEVFGPKIAIFGLKTGFYCNVSKPLFLERRDYCSCIPHELAHILNPLQAKASKFFFFFTLRHVIPLAAQSYQNSLSFD